MIERILVPNWRKFIINSRQTWHFLVEGKRLGISLRSLFEKVAHPLQLATHSLTLSPIVYKGGGPRGVESDPSSVLCYRVATFGGRETSGDNVI